MVASSPVQYSARTRPAAIWVLALSSLLGCGGEGGSLCADQASLAIERSCDIRRTACQQAVLAATECVSGRGRYEGEVRVISEEAYREELAERYGMDDDAPHPYADWDAALRLLGLLPAETTLGEVNEEQWGDSIAAYYTYAYRDITIIDRGSDFNLATDLHTLAHEFVHGLQDADQGLQELRSRHSTHDDTLIALGNIFEGEAEIRAELAMSVLRGTPVVEAALQGKFDRYLRYRRQQVVTAKSPYAAAKGLMHYATGPAYFAAAYAAGGLPGIEAVLDAPPLTSVRWMAGYEADVAGGKTWEQPLECDYLREPRGYRGKYTDALGAAMLFALLGSERQGMRYDVASAWDLALQWRADHFRVYRPVDEDPVESPPTVALAWQIRFSSKATAERFEAGTSQRDGWRIKRNGREIRVFAATDRAILDDWADASRCREKRPSD